MLNWSFSNYDWHRCRPITEETANVFSPLSTQISIFWTSQHLLPKHSHSLKTDPAVWYVASLDSVNLPSFACWSTIQLSLYPKLAKDRTWGTNRCSVSLCFSWPAALGIKASSSFRTSTATFTSSSSSMVYRDRGSHVRRKGDKKSPLSRICTSGSSANLTVPTVLTTNVREAEKAEISNTIWDRGRRNEQRLLEVISTLGKSLLSLIQTLWWQLGTIPPMKACKWWLWTENRRQNFYTALSLYTPFSLSPLYFSPQFSSLSAIPSTYLGIARLLPTREVCMFIPCPSTGCNVQEGRHSSLFCSPLYPDSYNSLAYSRY